MRTKFAGLGSTTYLFNHINVVRFRPIFFLIFRDLIVSRPGYPGAEDQTYASVESSTIYF